MSSYSDFFGVSGGGGGGFPINGLTDFNINSSSPNYNSTTGIYLPPDGTVWLETGKTAQAASYPDATNTPAGTLISTVPAGYAPSIVANRGYARDTSPGSNDFGYTINFVPVTFRRQREVTTLVQTTTNVPTDHLSFDESRSQYFSKDGANGRIWGQYWTAVQSTPVSTLPSGVGAWDSTRAYWLVNSAPDEIKRYTQGGTLIDTLTGTNTPALTGGAMGAFFSDGTNDYFVQSFNSGFSAGGTNRFYSLDYTLSTVDFFQTVTIGSSMASWDSGETNVAYALIGPYGNRGGGQYNYGQGYYYWFGFAGVTPAKTNPGTGLTYYVRLA